MTIEKITNSDLQYYLVSFDKNGEERSDDPDGLNGRLSEAVKKELAEQPITDVFLGLSGFPNGFFADFTHSVVSDSG